MPLPLEGAKDGWKGSAAATAGAGTLGAKSSNGDAADNGVGLLLVDHPAGDGAKASCCGCATATGFCAFGTDGANASCEVDGAKESTAAAGVLGAKEAVKGSTEGANAGAGAAALAPGNDGKKGSLPKGSDAADGAC